MDVFKLTIEDFESVLGRSLTEDEQDTILNRFNIDSWADEVEVFLDVVGIK